jgi:tetratricopeptide (TPR) repeat protein
MDTIETTDWDEDVQLDAAETYQALARSLDLTEAFGIFLVRCVEGERDQLIQRLRSDLPKQQMAELRLEAALEDGNLYNLVAAKLQVQPDLDVLFIDGLEKSFEAYIKPGYGGQGDYYKMDSVPRVLGHLNLQRERFRNDFPVSLVFFLSPFGLKYMARRSPDFFDWRSGIFEFVADQDTVEKLSQAMYGNYSEYLQWTHEQRVNRIREIQALLEEDHQTSDHRAILASEQGNIFAADQNYEAAIAAYDEALKHKLDKLGAWNNRGMSLDTLGRYEVAIASYDEALKHKPDYHGAWYNRGVSLKNLGQHEAAIASYDEALKHKPDYHEAWYNRGISLKNLGQYEAAIASYDEAVKHKPNFHEAWNNRGVLLDDLGQYKAAIASYDEALKHKPDYHEAWYNRGISLKNLGQHEAAIASYDEALRHKPGDHEAWYSRGISLKNLEQYEAAIASYEAALEIKPDNYKIWNARGAILCDHLKKYPEALDSFEKAIQYNSDDLYTKAHTLRNMGVVYTKTDRLKESILVSQNALEIFAELGLTSEMYPTWVKSMISFAQRSSGHLILCVVSGILMFPIALIILIVLISWRFTIGRFYR